MYQLIDQQLSQDLIGIDRSEDHFPEYGRGKVVIYMSNDLTHDDIMNIETGIRNEGVYLTAPIVQEGRALHIQFEKRIAPLLIIGGVVAALVVAGTAFFGWQVFQQIGDISPYLPWILGAGGLLLLWFLVR